MKKLLSLVLCLAMCLGILALTASAAGDSYVVAGEAGLCGETWNGSSANNAMTANSDGTYSLTLSGVSAGTYTYKIVKNGSDWLGDPDGNNWKVVVSTDCDVTITFNPETGKVIANGSGVTNTFVVAGDAGLCGEAWNASSTANTMTANSDGTYSLKLSNIAAGTYYYKIVYNGCWIGENGGSSNCSVTLTSADDITITYNPLKGTVEVTSSSVTETPVPVVAFMGIRGEGLDVLDWNADLVMTEVADSVYEYTLKNVPGSTWPTIKFTANGGWDYNFGCVDGEVGATSGVAHEGVWNSANNIWFEVSVESDVTFRLDLSNFDYETKTGATYTITVTPVTTEVTPDPEPTPDPDPEPTPDPEEMVTVHAKVPADWSTVCAYVWDGKGTDNTWPGYTMTLGNDDWYSVEVPAWAANVIIDNGGNGAQTQDIAINAGKDVWVVVEASDDGFVGTLTYSAPATGDSANLVAACAAMLLAGAGVVAMVAKKKEF